MYPKFLEFVMIII